jgi:peptide/nickel transport system permease protein
MQTYLMRRLLTGVFVLWGISVLVFSMVRLIPGDVVTAIMAESGTADPEEAARLRHELGLDQPAAEQYVRWLGDVVRGDLGNSLWSGQSIAAQFSDTLPVTIQLALMAMILALLIAVPVGVLSAIRQDTALDYGARVFAIFGVSIPDFLLGSLLLTWLVTTFGWAPRIVYVPPWEDPVGNLTQFLLPAAVLGYRFSATSMRMMRSALLEVLRDDYIRTAWAKGLRERVVVMRHALKNAFIPVITIIGMQTGYLLAGSVVVETVFNLPGMGQLLVQGIHVRDYTQVQASVLFIGAVMVLMNLLVDISYAWFDPRVRVS